MVKSLRLGIAWYALSAFLREVGRFGRGPRDYVVEVFEGLHHAALHLRAGGLAVVVVHLDGEEVTDSKTTF